MYAIRSYYELGARRHVRTLVHGDVCDAALEGCLDERPVQLKLGLPQIHAALVELARGARA